ncbi:iron-sulfur cluster biosynthesis family protein [Paenibacillus thalictri]|uniref:Iron-sulfur cluster biosynthesis family protein n=1 Tax=Paenibacillus thalictri TaxID=2527873 RepID=A0A4Q9DY57_9BACL|nr:iron-sulfur cluster biosynthesis family protein [Paenibacillus thalictri]TBL80180.1 iron-sulfur cluster biosynthesis family protein [Paenibacillus thalictri]
MYITFTESAVKELAPKLAEPGSRLRLVYDTEGCGCAVNGVPALRIAHHADPDDIAAISEPFAVSYKTRDEVFFEDKMKIDYNDARRSFELKSSQQIYSTNMKLYESVPQP